MINYSVICATLSRWFEDDSDYECYVVLRGSSIMPPVTCPVIVIAERVF